MIMDPSPSLNEMLSKDSDDMKKYRWECDNPQAERTKQTFHVIEVETHNIIKDRLQKSKALAMSKDLNRGRGFEGWTPTFFLANTEYD